MTPRIGVGVGADALRLVYVRRGRVRWSGEMDFEGADTLERALPELLRQSPLPRWPRPVVTVAVGPFATQLKRVTGLPPLSDPRLTASLIRENQSRFFMRNGQPLLTTGVRTIEDGAAWVGAVESDVVHRIEQACRSAAVTPRRIVPSAVALAHALEADRFGWSDGGIRLELRAHGGVVEEVRRRRSGAASDPDQDVVLHPWLEELGPSAGRFADAFGAAILPSDEPLALRYGFSGGGRPSRLGAAAGAAMVAALVAIVAPVPLALRDGARSLDRLDALSGPLSAASSTRGEIHAATSRLAALETLRGPKGPLLLRLRDLTLGLPEGTAITALQLGPEEGSVTVLTPRAAAFLHAMERVDGITGAAIVGPVSQERKDERVLERVTVAFTFTAFSRSERRP